MAQEQESTGLLDLINSGKSALDMYGFVQDIPKLLGGTSSGTGGYLAGGIPAYQGPGQGAAVATGASMLSMLPFTALAGVVVPKLIQGMFGEKPRITFTGADPKYHMGDGEYKEYIGKTPEYGSSKYNYKLDVKDTGKDGEIEKAMVQELDKMFDQMAASGVDVNDLLARNKNFAFGGRVDKGFTPEQLLTDLGTHFAPDVEAYQLGQTPAERQILVKPMSDDPAAGITNYDAGNIRTPYNITLGGEGVIPSENDQTTPNGNLGNADPTIMGGGDTVADNTVKGLYKELFQRDNPSDTEIQFWQDKLDSGELTPDNLRAAMEEAGKAWTQTEGGTQWVNNDTGNRVWDSAQTGTSSGDVDSGLGADDGQTNEERLIRGYYEDLFGRSTPDAEGVQYWTDLLNSGVSPEDVKTQMEQAGGAWTDQGDGNWLRDDGLAAADDKPTDYQYDIDNPQIFKDYVNSFYDQALQEYQKQSGQYQDATDQYKDTSSRLLDDQQDMLEGLTGRLDGSVTDYKDETGGYLDRLIQAIDDTNSSNLPTVNRLAGGQEVSYIPGSLRAANNDDRTAELALFDRSKGVSDNLLSTQTGNANTIWDAGNSTVNTGLNEGKSILGNDIVMANQGNATLNYLDKLQELVNMERDRDKTEAAKIAAENGLQFNYDQLASQEEAAEPGMLDYGMAIGTLGMGLGNLGKVAGEDGSLSWLNPSNWTNPTTWFS